MQYRRGSPQGCRALWTKDKSVERHRNACMCMFVFVCFTACVFVCVCVCVCGCVLMCACVCNAYSVQRLVSFHRERFSLCLSAEFIISLSPAQVSQVNTDLLTAWYVDCVCVCSLVCVCVCVSVCVVCVRCCVRTHACASTCEPSRLNRRASISCSISFIS